MSGLINLGVLQLFNNSITDISALRGHTHVFDINLDNNPALTDIQPLLDNTGLGPVPTPSASVGRPAPSWWVM